ncbi:hypothetical protein [Brevibacillus reuszeri]|uniref:hypothetical protein n=1 Tax=Brevibacillus reuszeri TaxID=54915 RepID=UPI000CCC3ADE|nr:hypothetical protein [Brevibacillus reuszeri]
MDERYVDQETGEIVRKETRILHGNQFLKIITPTKGGRSIKFVKTRTSQKAKRRMYNLTSHERGMLSIIALYAAPGTNVLLGDGERGQRGHPLTAQDLCKIGKYSKTQGYRLIQSLVEKNALGLMSTEDGQKVFVVNPDYYLNGKEADLATLHFFTIDPRQKPKPDESLGE